MPELTVATFNLHAGIDGWGVPFDVVACCAQLDADVLLLQETWTPEDGVGLASMLADSLGYKVHEATLSGAMIFQGATKAGRRWGPRRKNQLRARPLWVGDPAELRRVRHRRSDDQARLGSLGIALLSRLPVRQVEVIDLGRLPRDTCQRRAALLAQIEVGDSPISVVGTHLSHFRHGSPIVLERLRRRLPSPDRPAVLAGDMNFWGPPLVLALPGWRRAARARTYPRWRPHSQVDHIFVTRAVQVISGESLTLGESDHRPLRAKLAVA
jgi:endonuclease/exonuclease/phosphatase family metal-dependent hydrolase